MIRKQMKCWLAGVLATALLESPSSAQCQRQKLLASNGAANDFFGWAVALNDEWAAIGTPFADNTGSVYMFQRTSSGWVETQELKASDAAFGATFGSAVALSGTSLAIGAPGDDYQGTFSVGAVYVFDLTGSTWTETVKLHAGDPLVSDDSFGAPIAMEGDRLLIGARYDDGPGVDSGAAYVFDRVAGTWTQAVKLVGHDFASNDGINLSVALSGDRVILGVPYSGPPGQARGAAYVFEKVSGAWVEAQKLLAGDGLPNDQFGNGVALTGDLAAVGAPARNTPSAASGSAYAFQKTSSGWVQTQEFWADDTGSLDLFGESMVCSPEHLLVGSNVGSSGSAYDFRLSGSTWGQAGKLLPHDEQNNSLFGFALAVSGDTVLAGAPTDSSNCPPNNPGCGMGAAYIHQLAPTATQYGHCPTGAPCNNTDAHGGCRNSTGQGSILAACGSGGVTADDLQIEATHCPAHKSTLLFMGGIEVNAPFADGIRVVGGGAPGIYRYGIVQSDADGRVMRGPGLVAQSQGFHASGRIQPGQVWNFQVWYRDLAGPCGHLTNYSNGVQVAFTP